MIWSSPIVLLVLLAVPIAVALFAYAATRRREALVAFAAGDQMDVARSTARLRRWRAGLVVGAIALMGVALAGPRYGTELREIQQEGVDLLIALDVSNSMRAEDVAPNRLDRAKYEIEQVLGQLRGSRVGIVLFAGEAFLHCPLTTDLNAVRLFLGAADPTLIPTQGSDFADMIRVASQAFDVGAGGVGDEPRARVLLVVSDGEDHPERYNQPLRAAEDAGILIYSVGVGEPAGGPIPIYQDGRVAGYQTDRQGQQVITRLEEGTLRRVARTGAYYRIGRAGSDLSDLPGALARLDRTALASDQFASYVEQFQWPLGLALMLLASERLIARRRVGEPMSVS